ncbi:MAG: FRG domain-containing protein [Mesorhizobium sp.]|nr:MAG: FRG domain-containing protein [Mesorhizobium sp.]
MMFDHHSYYDPATAIDDSDAPHGFDPATQYRRWSGAGFSDADCQGFYKSGYVITRSGLVIDRYHGGALSTCDFRTRFPVTEFGIALSRGTCQVPVHRATSLADVARIVEKINSSVNRRLLFRGQTKSYSLAREKPNSFFRIPDLGEVSLMPSVWRRVLRDRPNVYHWFRNLTLFEWSSIIYSSVDILDIDRRVLKAQASGDWITTIGDMEDSEDPVLKKFGQLRADMTMEFGNRLDWPLSTLLQHYGLYSPALDLTTELDVAIFFATHRFKKESGISAYQFVGSNARQAVIYVIKEDRNESTNYERIRLLDELDPQRPKLQSCVIFGSGPDAMNLAADFLQGIIFLDFDLAGPGRIGVGHIFPREEDDRFLAALKSNLTGRPREALTDFYSH